MTNQLLTPKGKKKLEDELKKLQQKRVEVAIKIKDAKELGDLSENAEYHAAKEEQGFIEARILEIEFLLKSATLVKPTSSKSKIGLGSKIRVKSGGKIYKYEIVGLNEADPASGKISASSPLGAAFMGARAGEKVEVDVPAGKMSFQIMEIG